MTPRKEQRILMISLHGYVGANVEFGKPDTGGQVVFVIELAKRFARLGYKVDILTRRFEKQPEQDKINKDLRIWRIPFGGPDFIRKEDMHDHLTDFITNFMSKAARAKHEYSVVNSHYWDAGWAGQRIAEEYRIPHVHTPHSLGWWKRKDMKGGHHKEMEKVYRFRERIEKEFLIYRNCDHVIATTHHQKAILEEQYSIPSDHITIIPPGIDEFRFTPVLPNELERVRKKTGYKETDVFCVSRAAHNKGVDLLIRSLPTLRKLVPKARLQLAVGANSDRDKKLVDGWKQIARDLDVTRSVKWGGYIPDPDLADHYRAGGVFALPSRYEPFGMTAIEAMACATPTVVTVHGGLHQVMEFGKHGLYADPKRPEEFATMLSMPMRYPQLRERLSVEGARNARRTFGWTGIARWTLRIFEQVRGKHAMDGAVFEDPTEDQPQLQESHA